METQNHNQHEKEKIAKIGNCEILFENDPVFGPNYYVAQGGEIIVRCLKSYHEAITTACDHMGLITRNR